ncbi:MAG: FG-GAP-like repeat-containing protein, partial [Phycisphaerales bacterium]|nr:FG-GAP-like repeat-containing protein [Phycisphaerales bacterium]
MKTFSRALYRTCQGLSGIGALGIATSALAAPTGFYFEQEVVDQSGWISTDARQLVRVDVYLTFDDTSDHLNAVNGQTAPLDLTISTSDPSGFFQSANGDVDTTATRNSGLEPTFPSMAADSWVTIGLTDQTGNEMLDIGIDFTDFNSGGSLTIDNGAWFVTPPDAQGDATDNRVLIGRFTHAAGFSLSSVLNFQYVDGSSGDTEEVEGSSVVYRGAKSDFNGDGQSDILWRGDYGAGGAGAYEGSVISWTNWDGADLGYDSDFVYDTSTSTPIPEEWFIAGTGDMDGNGRADLVWRDADGSVIVWLMSSNGYSYTSHWFYSGSIADWRIAGIGDLDGDGQDDIMWQAEYGVSNPWEGTILAWEQWDGTDMGYTSDFIYNTVADPAIPSAWFIVGLADLDGNGRDGLVWR